ncbi:MAG: 50S ribosomal protein L13 [Candidatus Sungbacteria bacterium RIFCSPLOWO2_02_FULL_47_9]|uniref:Large ribosomal subunit protein uL13 n=1 Tax=Candidatus Sungbacteria bacterium RIFCSPHIGHO2_01_FULL_47_32 TaxID=1802264 RepID=A0A1G2K4T5_9BACT|nr:MAG: 50S ribosomal protein L13 [Parcubacteria group bacterium GW2011_GWA2_47_10]OGZ94427.1 MAG: 50S ribosomal protein L13 [Candidatus Sungbacteria bacterium RIFCSPHIGHO2_01_FULL_47_32]OGZ98019.1 MAG: 50S ribosomal protein L13 [Candidatus Sungbacteria bacterium RIFCSPHIGHO2_02_FULL_46_12]OHA05769.1 MAG: 50S ribosomal protein L13 [Candidatus Sungbacteria bacterium RIFCSPLOWO2_01_FULL_47_32]OHA12168.1 MAG: 50S ribosomal protein L13 [Candidatus Sungbacteria bacterium RIFCSPLOWO2_02_FULL_47_9]
MEQSFDAKGKILGRLATEVAKVLMGKNFPDYAPNKAPKGNVNVSNIDHIVVTGTKLRNKKYYHHSGYIGNLKTVRLEELMKKDSRKVFYKAVWNMLPKNRLRRVRMKHLRLFKGNAQ